MIKKDISRYSFVTKTSGQIQFSEGFFRHDRPQVYLYFVRNMRYPWQVASQLPFGFDNAKTGILEGIDEENDILQKTSKAITGLKRKCKALSERSHKRCKVFLGRVISDASNNLWISDIKYIDLISGISCLSFITDSCSHGIVGWNPGNTLQGSDTLASFKMALKNLKGNHSELIHHSDRGSQYCCGSYTHLLTGGKIQMNMNKNGNDHDNAFAERVNGSLKMEWMHDKKQGSWKESVAFAGRMIDLYNHQRLHQSISYMTPTKVHQTEMRTKLYTQTSSHAVVASRIKSRITRNIETSKVCRRQQIDAVNSQTHDIAGLVCNDGVNITGNMITGWYKWKNSTGKNYVPDDSNILNKSIIDMIKKEMSKYSFVKKESKQIKFSEGFFRHGRLQVYQTNRAANGNPVLTYLSVYQMYPWQVAPQQSLLPFRFDNAKVSIFEEKDFTLPKICLLLQKKCKAITGLKQKCKALLGLSQIKCKVFLGRDSLCDLCGFVGNLLTLSAASQPDRSFHIQKLFSRFYSFLSDFLYFCIVDLSVKQYHTHRP